MGETSPAFQFYPKDFLTDVKQIAMSLAEAGAYWRLCCHCWLNGCLPADLRHLARLCGASNRQMKEMWPVISPCFLEHEGALYHRRLEKERLKQTTYRQRASRGGIGKAASSQQVDSKQPTSSQQAVLNECKISALRSPISDLQSPISDLQTAVSARAPVALAGTFPRDHVRHGWCSSRGKCVPDFLHEEFICSIGGERQVADQCLRTFYEVCEHRWPEGPIGDDPVKLWRREFAASFPSVAPVKTTPSVDVMALALEKVKSDQARWGR